MKIIRHELRLNTQEWVEIPKGRIVNIEPDEGLFSVILFILVDAAPEFEALGQLFGFPESVVMARTFETGEDIPRHTDYVGSYRTRVNYYHVFTQKITVEKEELGG